MDFDERNFLVHFNDINGKRIRLPESFVSKWGSNLENHVRLQNRNGKEWLVELERQNNEIWLGEKWAAFNAYANIEYRDYVYFMYREGNLFDVVVIGLPGLEKVTSKAITNHEPVYFMKSLRSKHFSDELVLPDAFCCSFGKFIENPITMLGCFGVGCKVYWESNSTMESIVLRNGWGMFVDMYNISKNDILLFKFDFTKEIKVDVLPSESDCLGEFHSVVPRKRQIERIYIWELWAATLSDAQAMKGKPLYVPAKVAFRVWSCNRKTIDVIIPSGRFEKWQVIWAEARKECKLGKGWYEFKEEYKLKAGDLVSFGTLANDDIIHVNVVHKS